MPVVYVAASAPLRCSTASPRCRPSHADRRGWSTTRTSATAMNAGTIAWNASSGSTSSSTTPATSAAVTRGGSRAGGVQGLLRHDVHDDVAELALLLREPLAAQALPHDGASLAALAGAAAALLALDEIPRTGHGEGARLPRR